MVKIDVCQLLISFLNKMVVAFIGIGSNLGNRAKNINSALDNLGSVSGVRVVAMSSVS